MRRALPYPGLLAVAIFAAAGASLGPGSAAADEEWGGLPEGEGREIVYYNCQACHSLRIIERSSFDRRVWDEVLEWMVDTHGMQPLPEEDYDVVLDYLVEHFGPEN